MRKVEHIMGMAISIDIPGAKSKQVFDKVFSRLAEIDERFSPYKKDSELCRYQRSKITDENLSREFKQVIKACEQAEKQTDGYFTAYFSGKLDPTGYVKGWAIDQAGQSIEKEGFKTYCVSAGGDILARSDSDKTWKIGVQDPLHKQKILKKLSITNGAVATSGSYERGGHIVNPKTNKPAHEFLSLTVWGPNIITADVLATAAFAAGNLKLIKEQKNYKALAVAREVVDLNLR